jgi:hypothetical protein
MLLMKTIYAGVAQHHLQVAELDGLQGTLLGTVAVLADLPSTVQPDAFGRASRLRWSGSRLALELERRDAWQDSSCGIPKAIQSKYSSPSLLLSQLPIVQKHGGIIQLESEPGSSTTFVIPLPLESELVAS